MTLRLGPPVEPMLAKLVSELPLDGFVYEPKWDGFRVLAFRDGSSVDLRSRNQRPLARYFPEIAEALLDLPETSFVVDGEIVILGGDGRSDFPTLLSRLHPATSRVASLSESTPACYIAFDLLAVGDDVLLDRPFDERRRRLEMLIARDPRGRLETTPATEDPDVATRWLERFQGGGIDGVIAKRRTAPYSPGRREMYKVKRSRTADCVVAGFRMRSDLPALGALLLGLFDGPALRHVGVASSFSARLRSALLDELEDLVTPLEGHPWEHGFGLERNPVGRLAGAAGRWVPGEMAMDWVPVRPERVCEVSYHTLDGHRFRYPARFVRWRADRDPASCTFDQFEDAAPDVAAILSSSAAPATASEPPG